MIAEDWMKPKTNKELNVMMKQAQYARVLTLIGYTIMFFTFILSVAIPLCGVSLRYVKNATEGPHRHLLKTGYMHGKENQSPYFQIIFAIHVFITAMFIASYSGADSLFGMLVFHLCGQIENLRDKLIHIKEFKTFSSGLAFIVKNHVRLIKFRIEFSKPSLKIMRVYVCTLELCRICI